MLLLRSLPLIFFFSLISCAAGLWNLDTEEAKKRLANGDYSFLETFDDKKTTSADLSALGPGAYYYAGFVLADLKKPELAERFWNLSREKDPEPWKRLSVLEELRSATARRDWPVAEKAARWLVQAGPGDLSAQRSLVEALYWQKKDAEAWTLMQNWKNADFSPSKERENLLFRGVIAARLGKKEEAAKALKTLVYDTSPGLIHYRVYSFFEEDPRRYALLGADGRIAALWQSMAGQGMSKEADRWLTANKSLSHSFWSNPVFLQGFGSLFRSPAFAEHGLRWLESFHLQLKGEALFVEEMNRGAFYRSLERWGPARTAFQKARVLASNPQEKDRASWNWLNAWINLQPVGALGAFRQVLGETGSPSFYSDVLSSWIAFLVQNRAWHILAAVYNDLGPLMTHEDRATAGFLLARLARHGFLNLKQEGVGETTNQLLEETITAEPFSYESLVSRAILGRTMDFTTRPDIDATDDVSLEEPLPTGAVPRLATWVDGFLRFGLAREAGEILIRRLNEGGPGVDPKLIRDTAQKMQEHQEYVTSLLLMDAAVSQPGYPAERDDWELLFPQAWSQVIDAQAEANQLDPSLLYALIRVESSFDPNAKSWVGAVGLSQLMPSTAAYVAEGLKIKTYDLADPQDNLTLGARYLADMVRVEDKVFLALMAYNAGTGRIHPWKAALGRLPQELFVEGVPITETRNYVKKVLRSAVLYGLLYHEKSLGQMVQLIYPDFLP